MRKKLPPLSREIVKTLLDTIAPETTSFAIHELPGSYSNITNLVEAQAPDGTTARYVVRRYVTFGTYSLEQKARREFKTYELLYPLGAPVPEPLFLDDAGDVLDTPGIVTRYVSGQHVMSPADPLPWAQTLAKTLADLHSIACDTNTHPFLLDANTEALWFLYRNDAMPDLFRGYPQGPAVWQTIRDCKPAVQPVSPTLIHLDYWSGNVLWNDDRIAAVIDWEEAAYGDPAIDVAYCRMDMFQGGMDEAADAFVTAYEAHTGHPTANLGFWELAAVARPMHAPDGWISESPAKERFVHFVDQALERALRG